MSYLSRFTPRCHHLMSLSLREVTAHRRISLSTRRQPLSLSGCNCKRYFGRMAETKLTVQVSDTDSCQNDTDTSTAVSKDSAHIEKVNNASEESNVAASGSYAKMLAPGKICSPAASVDVDKTQDVPSKEWTKLSRRAKKRLFRQKKIEAAKLNKKMKREKKGKVVKDPNFTTDCLQETDYYVENGLRKVYPYYFDFTTYAKGRWVGQTLMEIFEKEFRNDTPENYRKVIEAGKVMVNFKPVTIDYKLKNNDYIENRVHRHELPVTADPIEILEDNEKVLVINKPSSIPVHPCGRYRHNSLTYILGKQYGYKDFRTIYRLDRLTSGVMIFTKSEKLTRDMQNSIKGRNVEKEYVCRVTGEFSEEEVECAEPMDVLSHTMGIFHVCSSGKEASTNFKRLFFDSKSNTSVVKCFPHTGRTHQIRVHLQWIGYPIVNDPIYNSRIWGPECGKAGSFGKSKEQLVADLLGHHSAERHLVEGESTNESVTEATSSELKGEDLTGGPTPHSSASLRNTDIPDDVPDESLSDNDSSDCQPTKKMKLDVAEQGHNPVEGSESVIESCHCPGSGTKLLPFDESKSSYNADCTECQRKYKDPQPKDLVMYLHALRYKGPGWEYATPMPAWAALEWQAPS